MRLRLLACLALTAIAFQARADTLNEVTTKGIVVTIGGADIDFTFTPDGHFSAANGALTGKWRIDGDKLCTQGDSDANENCLAYPSGKKSGDSFPVETGQGALTVKIK